jgi:PAS domain S-box-containing protein
LGAPLDDFQRGEFRNEENRKGFEFLGSGENRVRPPSTPFTSPHKSALRIAAIYAVLSALWILCSDKAVDWLVSDEWFSVVSMVKGWVYTAVLAGVLYLLFLRELKRHQAIQETLRQMEANYRTVFNSTQEVIFIHDAQTGRILDVNQATLNMFGYTREEALSLSVGDLSSGQSSCDQETARALIHRAFQEGPQLFEWECRRKNGEIFWVEVALSCFEPGNETRVIAVVRDISERKKNEQVREEEEKRLRQAQKMEAMGALAGGVAHDFNNILTAIIGYADLGREDLLAENRDVGSYDEIIKAGHRAKDIVQQILGFSRHEEEKFVPVALEPVVREAVRFIRATIPSTIEIEESFDPHCGVIRCDSTQIHQVVMNLCTNAYHAMREQGSGILHVSLSPATLQKQAVNSVEGEIPPGDYVRLVISDTGCGIEDLNLERIFDPYFTTKSRGEGTGMGLSVVLGIVKSVGGYISVKSRVGSGTAFQLYFPCCGPEQETKPSPPPGEYNSSPRHGTGRILFVDDEEPLTRLGQRVLESLGYRVQTETSPVEAWAQFLKDPSLCDLVITDMSMPKMSGADLAQRILSVRPDLPILLCSGFSETFDAQKAADLGIREFLVKPVSKADLAAAVARSLES